MAMYPLDSPGQSLYRLWRSGHSDAGVRATLWVELSLADRAVWERAAAELLA